MWLLDDSSSSIYVIDVQWSDMLTRERQLAVGFVLSAHELYIVLLHRWTVLTYCKSDWNPYHVMIKALTYLCTNVWPMVSNSRLRSSVYCWKSFWFLAFILYIEYGIRGLCIKVLLLCLLICLYKIWCWYATFSQCTTSLVPLKYCIS